MCWTSLLARLRRLVGRPPAEPSKHGRPPGPVVLTFPEALEQVAAMAADRTTLAELPQDRLLVYANALECVAQVATVARDRMIGECRRRGIEVRFVTLGLPR